MNVSQNGERILDALLWRVRAIAFSQVVELVGNVEAEKCLRSLLRNDLVEPLHVRVKLLRLVEPIFEWEPGQSREPDFWKLSWASETRFDKADTESHTIYIATKKASRHFGGVGGQLRQPFQLQHDLGTASMFVAYVRAQTTPQEWVGEDSIRRYHRHMKIKKIPDAAVVADERVVKAMEFAGRSYSGDYIQKFHLYWKTKSTPYEIW